MDLLSGELEEMGKKRVLRPFNRPAACFLLPVLLVLAGCGGDGGLDVGGSTSSSASAPSTGVRVVVSRVVDGDTLEISPPVGGESTVRIIGADTPEDVRPGYPVQPLAIRAASFTRSRLEGRRVRLTFDEERKDRYGRLLAYVWVDRKTMLEDELLRRGLAQLLIIPPNDRYAARFAADQRQARRAHRGIWGLPRAERCQETNRGNGIGEGSPGCGPGPDSRGSAGRSPGVAPSSEESCPRSYPVKGNITRDGQKIYHLPKGDPYYQATHPERCFASARQARAAGYRPPILPHNR